MESPTLGNIFTKHLGFPARRGAALGAEDFVERMATRVHAFVPEKNDPEAWVEHFFEIEHPVEERQKELETLGASESTPAVLEFELGENEFVVIDDEDEVVVVSDRGSIVLSNTSELRSRLTAAQLPATQSSPTAAFKGQGDRAFYVSQSGKVLQLDAKLVAKAIQSAPTPKVEPLARVAGPSRLAAFSPVERREAKKTSFATETVRSVARAESKGGSTSPQVVVVEKNNAKQVSGQTARFWQRMATALTAGGRQSENLGRSLPGASAVALGRQTYAVKAGGVTALVHRPVQGLGGRADVAANRATAIERKNAGSSPWVRDVLGERPRGNGFWIQPAVAQSTVGVAKPQWVERALSQARDLRMRAREESRGHLDPKPVSHQPQVRAATGVFASKAPQFDAFSNARIDFANLGAVLPGKLPSLSISEGAPVDLALPEIRVHSSTAWPDDAPRPLTVADAMPASTLRALYTGLERTAAAEGHRISSISLDMAPTSRLDAAPAGTTEAFVETRFGAPEIRTIEVETERIAISPVYYEAPFASDGGMRVGDDLSSEIDRRVVRGSVSESTSTWSPKVTVSKAAVAAPERVRTTLPAASTTVATIPSAVSMAMGAQAAPARLNALAWLDWAVTNAPYARAKKADGTPAAVTASRGPAAVPPPAAPPPDRTDGRLPYASSVERAFGRHDVSHVQAYSGSAAAAESRGIGAQAFATGSHVAFSDRSPAHAPAAHEASHVVQQRQGSTIAIASMAPEQGVVARGADPVGGHAHQPEGMGVRAPSPEAMGVQSRHEVAKPITLTAVNDARAPMQGHAPATAEGAAPIEHVEIGVPLHVQMTEARQGHAAPHALAESAPSVSLVPIISTTTTTVDAGGHAPAAAPSSAAAAQSGSRSSVTLARPSGGFAPPAAPPPPGRGSSSGASHAALAAGAPELAVAAATSGSMLPDRAHRKGRGEGEARLHSGEIPAAPPPPSARGAAIPQRDKLESSFGSHDFSAVHAQSGAAPGAHEGLSARAYTGGSEPVLSSGSMELATPAHESAHVVQQAHGVSAAASHATGSAPPAPPPLPRSTKAVAEASTGGVRAAPGKGPSEGSLHSASASVPPPAAPPAPGRKGSGYLKFKYPAEPRWWGTKDAPASGSSASSVSAHAASGSAAPLVTKRLDAPEGHAAAPAGSLVHTPPAAPPPPGHGTMSSPAAYGSRGARINGPASDPMPVSAPAASSSSAPSAAPHAPAGEYAHIGGQAPRAAMAPHDGEMAYVAVAPTGEAKVVSKSAAAQLQAKKKGGVSVDMTVVAGIAPQAPSVEDMALAGHERPHAKGKKEGGAKGAAHGKTDALSLQGTVDSLAQRIYHRLKRRLASDRERFGG